MMTDVSLYNHPTLNPYRIAAGIAGRRLLWDLKYISWTSRKRMRAWKDRYIGQKAIIVCNGPSLLQTDLSLLKDTFCFGLNKINLIYPRTSFRPSCIVAQQEYVIEQNSNFFNETDTPLFISNIGLKIIKPRQNVVFYHESHARYFSRDCSISLYGGHTVTFAAMQLAFHMGFQQVALIGCDHNFATQGTPNKTEIAQGPDLSHFDSNYFAQGSKWVLPDLFGSEISYQMAKVQYEGFGRRLVNSTEGGKLELLDRVPLHQFLAS